MIGTLMTRIRLIRTDTIRLNPHYPRHQRSVPPHFP